ncbi:YcaO-like family protein [Streptomonospora litoralis]|uniref:YcaO-like family protein n=1 Tax=Streptomonospora litoralis TaxID=2498135 RepID=A0A4P6Q1E7_9ACTN|nr:YcaO-like family protein [Streptomonospora litoralis]QBI53051.1 YcaO-like family protein [Streptomonospora litoralis]
MSTPTQTPLAADLVSALAADTDAPAPAEVLLGPLTGPARVRADESGAGRGLAVLFWCGSVHVLAYDVAHERDGGCPRCLAWFLTRNVDSAEAAFEEPSEAGSAGAVRSHALWQQVGPALRTVVTRTAALLLRETSPAGTLATVDRADGAVRRGHVPPRTGCPARRAATARTTLAFGSAPELLEKSGTTLRARRPLPPTITTDYLGPHSLFREPLADLDGPLPQAQVGLPLGNGVLEPGIGRSRSFAKSRRTAVLEGLERHTGFCHQPAEGTVEASLAELGDRAVDPRTLGYHSAEQYARDDFPWAPLGPAESVEWVPITPLGDGPARYLPEVALSWVRRAGTRKPFFYDTSNGFALGQSHEEATLHGLFEIVERDAFLLTWYRRLLLPELALGPADGDIRELMERVEVVTGFRVRLFWATLDIEVPVVLALAQRDADSGPCTLVSTAAGLYPRAAAESAIFEVSARVASIRHVFDDDPVHRERLAKDFDSLVDMDDHSLLGALPQSREWFAFLTSPDRPEMSLASAAAEAPEFDTLDKDLDYVRAQIEAAGSHAYAADVTTPELHRSGLVCTRSFVPGCLPMTFGHATRRLEGLPRLHSGALPYASQLLAGQSPADVPPHPFA